MIYLFNNYQELLEVIKTPTSATMTRRINAPERLLVETDSAFYPTIEDCAFMGHFHAGRFYLYTLKRPKLDNNRLSLEGVSYAYDHLAGCAVIEDKRPQDVSASAALLSALEGTGWELGTIETTPLQSTSFYYITPAEAIQKIIETWQVELDLYYEFDGRKITGKKIDVLERRGRLTGERYVWGSDLMQIVQEENREGIVTALYGRGKGEEILDGEGNPTGAYGRRLEFTDVVWSTANGDPADKPAGQSYVEIPEMTALYGYPSEGALSPRYGVLIMDQVEDPEELLRRTWDDLVQRSRPLVTLESTVAKAGPYDLGDSNYIIRPDLGFYYEARIFEDEVNLINPNLTRFKFGDYIPSGQVKRAREMRERYQDLTAKINEGDRSIKDRLIKVSQDWYDALMDAKGDSFFSEASFNYSLDHGNEYGLPAGYYSFNAPIDENPTGFLVIYAGKIGRGEILPGGAWDFNLIGDSDGLTADAITAGTIKAQFIEIGSSSTFLEGYDPSTKANAGDVYTITEIDTKFQVLDGQIISIVSEKTDSNGDPLFAKTSEVKQTVDNWTATFSQIGGTNLIRGSHQLSDKFEVYQGSTFTTVSDNITVPEWDTTTATKVRTTSLGTSDLKARWVISDDITFMTGRDMVFSIWAKNNRDNVAVTIGTNRIGEPIILAPLEMKRLEYFGVPEGNEGRLLILELSAPTDGHYLDVTLFHPKWELGNIITDWSPHPDEFYTGVTKIDKDGITVARSNQDINSHLGSNGLIISEGEMDAPGSKAIAGFTDGGAWIGNLKADTIRGDVVNTRPGGIINIGSGYDYTSISEALKDIGNAKHLTSDLTFRVYNQLNEDIIIRGFTGGMVYIAIMAGGSIHGDVSYYQNGSSGYLYGYSKRELVRGSIRVSGPSHLFIRDLNMDPNDTSKTGLVAEYGGSSFITNCDIIRCRFGALAQNGGTITALDNIGLVPGSNAIYNTYNGGVLYARGTMPTGSVKFGGSTTGFWHDFTTTQEPSEYDPPTESPTLMTQTFSPTKLETYSYQYDAISSYYPDRAAQNRWDTDTSMFEGRITFAGAVRNYINDRNGDAGLKVELQVRRYSGTNGVWSGVAPDKQFAITGGSFGSVEKGAWSGWVTLSPTLIPTSGYTFKFGSQSTGDKYAVWDGARIRVTKTKNI